MRCDRLFRRRGGSDPRVRNQQLKVDRRRRQRISLGLCGLGIVLPGLAHLFEGRALFGALRVFLVGTGAALVLAQIGLPVPWDVGSLGVAVPELIGAALLGPLYVLALLESYRRLRDSGAMG